MKRSRWLDYEPVTADDRIAELVVRHHLGEYQRRPAVQQRLDAIFAEHPTPPDAVDRLLRACDHLEVTGRELERLADEAVNRKRTSATTPAIAERNAA